MACAIFSIRRASSAAAVSPLPSRITPANPLMNLPLDRKTPLRTVRSDGAKLRFHSGACRQTRSRRALQIVEYFSSRRCEAERLFLAHSKDEAAPGTLRGTKDCRSHAAPQRE